MGDIALARQLLNIFQEELDPKSINVPPEDFFEFARDRLWIKDKGGQIVRFQLNSMQRNYVERKRRTVQSGRPARYLVLKYRRGGISTIEQGLSYKMCVTRSNSSVMSISHKESETERLFEIPLLMSRSDPQFAELGMRPGKKRLEFKRTGSTFFLATAGGSGAARGDTLQRIHGSEVSRWAMKSSAKNRIADQEDLLSGITEAASHGEIVLETTPLGMELFQRMYAEAKKSKTDWTPIFLRWFDDPTNVEPIELDAAVELMDTITDEEAMLVRKHNLRPAQIAWRRRKRAQPELRRLFPQEYPEDDESCFLRSGDPFFDVDALYNLIDTLPPGTVKNIPGGKVTTWEDPIPNVRYVAGADVAEGLPTGDYSHLGIMRKDTGVQVASIHGHFRPNVFAELCVEKCREYNRSFLGVERNNTGGGAAVQKIVDLGYRSTQNLYYMDRESKNPSRPGWSTDVLTRDNIINALNERVCAGTEWIRDGVMVSEMLSFHRNDKGKYEADAGCFDDTIFGWGIAEQMRRIRVVKPQILGWG